MNTLLLRFTIDLTNTSIKQTIEPHGPLFHRWLPNGESDAISIEIPEYDAKIKIWFDRCGCVFSDFIQYDENKHEIDIDIMKKQGVLDGGLLQGLLTLDNITEEELNVLKEEKTDDKVYELIGEKIVKKILCPNVSRFIKILRNNYGQYWLKELVDWDSREGSLGFYCRHNLKLSWCLLGSEEWKAFIPNKPVQGTIIVTLPSRKGFKEYLSKQDWETIRKYYVEGYFPPYASDFWLNSHKLFDEGDFRQAFIESVTAFEIALSKYLKDKVVTSKKLLESLASFYTLPLSSQLTVLAINIGLDTNLIENALEAIKTRNKIIHEGFRPTREQEQQIKALIKITSRLIDGPNIKFPTMNSGNCIMSEEKWEKSE